MVLVRGPRPVTTPIVLSACALDPESHDLLPLVRNITFLLLNFPAGVDVPRRTLSALSPPPRRDWPAGSVESPTFSGVDGRSENCRAVVGGVLCRRWSRLVLGREGGVHSPIRFPC